jgi:hypothetical protein
MAKKRPCSICRRWFQPNPRTGARQRVCGSDECQRERHRRACKSWHQENPDYDRERRLRDRVVVEEETIARDSIAALPSHRLRWSAVRDAVGLEVAVVIEESSKVIEKWARDAVRPQPP